MNKEEFKNSFGHYPFQKTINKAVKAPRSKKVSTHKPKSSMTSKEFIELSYESMTEEEHQKEFISWLDRNEIYFEVSINGLYIPNPHPKNSRAFAIQNASNMKVLSKIKAQGFRKGVCDIKIYLKNRELNIELKKLKGTASKEQKAVKEIINKTSYAEYYIVKGYKEAIKIVEDNLRYNT